MNDIILSDIATSYNFNINHFASNSEVDNGEKCESDIVTLILYNKILEII